jgi:plastocyanin
MAYMHLKRLAVILGATAVASCSSNPSGPSGGHSTTIAVNSNFFSPTPDTVSAGTVTFSWSSGPHNVTWDSGPGTLPANSSNKSSGTQAVALTAGTYQYHCTLHGLPGSGMHGTIVVQ